MFDFTLAGAVIAKRSRQRNRGAYALAGNPHVVAIIQDLLLVVIETDRGDKAGMPQLPPAVDASTLKELGRGLEKGIIGFPSQGTQRSTDLDRQTRPAQQGTDLYSLKHGG